MTNEIEPAATAVRIEDKIEDLQEIIRLISNEAPINLARRDAEAEQTIKERETERRGKEDYFILRKQWSWYLCIFLATILAFQVILTFSIGLKLLSFEDNRAFLYTVVGENFLQIIGMCVIVVKFLFPIKSSNNED